MANIIDKGVMIVEKYHDLLLKIESLTKSTRNIIHRAVIGWARKHIIGLIVFNDFTI